MVTPQSNLLQIYLNNSSVSVHDELKSARCGHARVERDHIPRAGRAAVKNKPRSLALSRSPAGAAG